MPATQKDPVLVTLQLSGGTDSLTTLIPFNDPLYRDNRPAVGIPDDQILRFDKNYGFHPAMAPLKKVWDEGKLAIVHGVGYAHSPRSHFRSMDIWHTCEPEKVGTQGWLGQVAREYDPRKENVVNTVSFGQRLFPALGAGRPWSSRGVCVWPAGEIRVPAQYPGTGAAPAGARSLREDVRTGRGHRRDGVPRHHRSGFLEGRGHLEGGTAEVRVHRQVPRDLDRPQAQGDRPGPLCRSGEPDLLL